MPTPDETSALPPLVRTIANATISPPHATCPPDNDCVEDLVAAPEIDSTQSTISSRAREINPFPTSSSEEESTSPGAAVLPTTLPPSQQDQYDAFFPSRGETTHLNNAFEPGKGKGPSNGVAKSVQLASSTTLFPPLSRGLDQSSISCMPQHTSSFLKHGSKFVGTQHSDRQVYNVSVELKHVDMRESFLCGYLRIEGLTDAHPTLTTYFEGEIIGNKYTFQTRHEEWGSNIKVDMQHWNRFPAWRPLARAAQQSDFSYRNYAEREHLFMRWKEYFLVPDHRVRSISGASFEGFYYICFNQILGTVSGIYFHSKSEKFQQLELKHVHDYGSKTALEFI